MSSTTYADEGTIAHALAAMCLTENKDAAAFVGRVIEAEDYEHAKLSPSTAHRWMRCQGSHALESSVPFKPRKFSMAVTADMARDVQVYVSMVRAYVEAAPGCDLLVEQRLPVDHITGETGAWGTGDVVILDYINAEIVIIDLKFGRGVAVYAEDNEQLLIYGDSALEQYAPLAPEGGWKSVRMIIHQPRIDPRPSEWVQTASRVRAFAQVAKMAAQFARNAAKVRTVNLNWDKDNLVPGEKQCKFCNAKATCPALRKTVEEDIGASFEMIAEVGALPHEPTDEGFPLAAILKALPLIDSWCKAVAAHAESKLLAGEKIAGWKVVQGKRGNRAWSSEAEAEATLRSFRVKHDQMFDYSVISPTSAEKLTKGDEAPLGDRQWKKLQTLITQSDGKPTVVPESDKRPALEIKPVADEFTNIEEEELV